MRPHNLGKWQHNNSHTPIALGEAGLARENHDAVYRVRQAEEASDEGRDKAVRRHH